jgi:hypothetical protein
VARGTSWEWARQNGDLIDDTESRSHHLIDTADVIAGFRFAKLDYVREYKIALGRAKDLADIAAIDASRHRSGC